MTFPEFQKSLLHYLTGHGITGTIKPVDEKVIDVELVDEDGYDFYIGNYADSGARIEWLGDRDLGDTTPDTLVRVSGVVMSAFPKHVVGWMVGYD